MPSISSGSNWIPYLPSSASTKLRCCTESQASKRLAPCARASTLGQFGVPVARGDQLLNFVA